MPEIASLNRSSSVPIKQSKSAKQKSPYVCPESLEVPVGEFFSDTSRKFQVEVNNFIDYSIREAIAFFDQPYYSCSLIAVSQSAPYGSFPKVSFLFYLPPGNYSTCFAWSELGSKGKALERIMGLPYPGRYLQIDAYISATISRSDNRKYFTLECKLSHVTYTFTKPEDIADDFAALSLGQFLPNSYIYPKSTFCASWMSHTSFNLETPNVTTAQLGCDLEKTLANYFSSAYNNHWFHQMFSSPSFYVLVKAAASEIKYSSEIFTKYIEGPFDPLFYKTALPDWRDIPTSELEQASDAIEIYTYLHNHPNFWVDNLDLTDSFFQKVSLLSNNTSLGSSNLLYSLSQEDKVYYQFSPYPKSPLST